MRLEVIVDGKQAKEIKKFGPKSFRIATDKKVLYLIDVTIKGVKIKKGGKGGKKKT